MKTVGLIGGTGPESTVEYYRLIISGYSEQSADGSYPSIVIHSLNLPKLLALMNAGKLDEFAEEFANGIALLDRAGVDFGALTANTPHIVFDELRRRSRIPLISIVETTCDRARELGLKRVGLLGTGFTMQASFYPEVFSRAGISVIVPDDEQQAYIHEKYIGELLKDVFLPETRDRLLAIADQLKTTHNIEALILGGTELPLLLRPELFENGKYNGLHMLDTTRIHVERIVKELLADE